MKLEIAGKQVEVDDSFAKLSDAEKQATVNEIASHIQSAEPKQSEANPQGGVNAPGPIQRAIAPVFGAGAAAGGAIMAVPHAVAHFARENPVLAAGAGYLMKDKAKELMAKGASKVADMASSNAVRDIALQGLQRGVQGVTAAAGAIAPYVRGLSGAALALHSQGLNNGEDQLVQQMHQQQDQQMASGQIAPPQGPVAPGQ